MWKRKKREQQPSMPNPLLEKIGNTIIRRQHSIADKLNARTQHWTKRQQLVFLSVVLLGFSALILGMLLVDDSAALKTQNITTVPIRPELLGQRRTPRFNRQDSLAVRSFRLRLDSLNSTNDGREKLRAFMARRPGFLDSMLTLEKMLYPNPTEQIDSSTNKLFKNDTGQR